MPSPLAGRACVCHGGWRILRATVVASVAILVAVGGHLAGGGTAPGAGLLTLVVVVASVLCAYLSQHRWSVRALAGTLLATQALVHLLCGLASTPSGEAHGGPMLAWHLVATAVSLGVLLHGEALAWRLVEVIALRPIRAALQVVAAGGWAAPRLPAGLAAALLSGASWWERSLVPVRGPPA